SRSQRSPERGVRSCGPGFATDRQHPKSGSCRNAIHSLVARPRITPRWGPSTWSFDDLLNTLVPHLPEDERVFADKLGEAILDKDKVTSLEDEPIWIAVDSIPLDIPWPG